MFMLWQIWESSQHQELRIIRKVYYLTTVHISSSASCAHKISWTMRCFCYLCNNSRISVKIQVCSRYWEQELQVVTHWSYCKHFCKEKSLMNRKQKENTEISELSLSCFTFKHNKTLSKFKRDSLLFTKKTHKVQYNQK